MHRAFMRLPAQFGRWVSCCITLLHERDNGVSAPEHYYAAFAAGARLCLILLCWLQRYAFDAVLRHRMNLPLAAVSPAVSAFKRFPSIPPGLPVL